MREARAALDRAVAVLVLGQERRPLLGLAILFFREGLQLVLLLGLLVDAQVGWVEPAGHVTCHALQAQHGNAVRTEASTAGCAPRRVRPGIRRVARDACSVAEVSFSLHVERIRRVREDIFSFSVVLVFRSRTRVCVVVGHALVVVDRGPSASAREESPLHIRDEATAMTAAVLLLLQRRRDFMRGPRYRCLRSHCASRRKAESGLCAAASRLYAADTGAFREDSGRAAADG